jgi:hypothetical protein
MDERIWIRLLPWRRKDRADSKSAQVKYACQLGFTQESGWSYLELLLVNRSSWAVWVGMVAYSRPDLGMGISFIDIDKEDERILELWIQELMRTEATR